MPGSQSLPSTRIRTFANGNDGEIRCTALVWPPGEETGWQVSVEGELVGADGEAHALKPATQGEIPVTWEQRPTKSDLDEAIDRFLGDVRQSQFVETTAVTMQILDMLALGVGMVGGLIHDPELGVIDGVPHASLVARVLVLGQGPEVTKYASILVGLACGMHPEPPRDWLDTPVGAIAVWEGLLERAPFSEAISATAAAAMLGEEEGRSAIVRLVEAGHLDRHPVSGVTRESVRALLRERGEEGRWSLGDVQ